MPCALTTMYLKLQDWQVRVGIVAAVTLGM